MSTVYNVLSHGFSVGLTRKLSDAEQWKRGAADPRAVIVDTGTVDHWEAPPSNKAEGPKVTKFSPGKRPKAGPKEAGHAKRGEPDRKAAKKLQRRRNDYAKTLAGKDKYTCPGSLQRG